MCQQSSDEEDEYVDEDDEGSAESILIGAACDLVSALCETLGDNFSSYFDVFMPLISSYYVNIIVRILARKRLMTFLCTEEIQIGCRQIDGRGLPSRMYQRHQNCSDTSYRETTADFHQRH